MRMFHTDLDLTDVHGSTLADLVVGIEATFAIEVSNSTIFIAGPEGWVTYSGWDPDVVSRPTSIADVVRAARRFIDEVRTDIEGRGLDAAWILDLDVTP